MQVTYQGYVPNTLQVKKDVPVRWVIDVKEMTRCTDTIILPDYNIRKPLQMGENIVEFTPDKAGVIRFSCWMRMVWGKFVVS
jgi:plastocyanin domain-containing protein